MESSLPIVNVANGHPTHRIFSKCTRGGRDDDRPTHLLLTGGTYCIHEDEDLKRLYSELGEYFGKGGTEMACVSENRTKIFPMYFDFDFKIPVATLSTTAMQTIATIILKQTMRFYAEEQRSELGQCIVLDKTGHATQDDKGLYKHGLHIHMPMVKVEVDAAYQIRMGVLNGLTSFLGSWDTLLGVDPGDGWSDIVDEAVYRGGLRMPYSPKASKCRSCPAKRKPAETCYGCRGQNLGHIIDTRCYKPCMVLDGNGERDAAFESRLKKNPHLLFSVCSVRTFSSASVTEGYAIYPGCPLLSSLQLSSAHLGKKQKLVQAPRVGGRKCNEVIQNPNVETIVRRYLYRYSQMYETCRVEIKRGGGTIRANLKGDDSKFCINKNGHHRSNAVYMEIVKKGSRAVSIMKCYCSCKTTEGRTFGVHCSNLGTRTEKSIDQKDVEELFVNTANTAATSVESTVFGNACKQHKPSSVEERKRMDEEMLKAANIDFL